MAQADLTPPSLLLAQLSFFEGVYRVTSILFQDFDETRIYLKPSRFPTETASDNAVSEMGS
jgi:hypothetical protein